MLPLSYSIRIILLCHCHFIHATDGAVYHFKARKMADESGQHQPGVVVFKQFRVVVHAPHVKAVGHCRRLPCLVTHVVKLGYHIHLAVNDHAKVGIYFFGVVLKQWDAVGLLPSVGL